MSQFKAALGGRTEVNDEATQHGRRKKKEKKSTEKCAFSTETFHSAQKKETGDFGGFLKTRVGGGEEHLISPRLTCARWA